MLFSYNLLQSFFKKKLRQPKKLAEILTMHSFEVEEVERAGDDWVLDIDILPNRGPDCFSHLGIAREISALLDLKLESLEYTLREEKKKTKDFIKLEVKSKKDCPRYTAKVFGDVKITPSPKWMRDRLKALGLKPINNVVDIANYVMLEMGQPLHAFDWDKISKQKIIVRRAKRGERIMTLDNERYDLDKDILIIADAKGPLAIAGIKGGKRTEIDKKTKTIVLESANFHPKVIRWSSKKIDLKTDASWRFEHGLDLNLTELALNRVAFLIEKIAKGKVFQGLVDFYPQKVSPKRVQLNLDYVHSLLGVKISPKKLKDILGKLGFQIIQKSKKKLISQFLIKVPTFRLDISSPEDLIEEIGRIYGYYKISSDFPVSALIPPKRNLEIFWENMIKDILKGAGFTEVYSNSFINEKQSKIFGYNLSELIKVKNPPSADYQYLRPSLIPNLIKSFEKNQKFFPEINIFELGKTFKKSKKREKRALLGLMNKSVFYKAKGVIDLLLNSLGISDIWYDQYQPTPEESKVSIWNFKKCAEIKVGNQEIGFLGEVSLRVIEKLKLDSKITLFDLDFDKLLKLVSEEQEFSPISPYPAAIRDIAVLVPRGTLVEEVLNKIEVAGGELIRDVDLFDIYEGKELPAGKKNLAFHIVYQAEDRTLSSKEVDKIQNKIVKTLEKELDWEVRRNH